MAKIIIIGAGAIGRGYLPWVLNNYEMVFVDSNPQIVESMRKNGGYSTYRVRGESLESMRVPVKYAYFPADFDLESHQDAAAVFINVGPRHCGAVAKLVEGLTCPVILSENDPLTVDTVKCTTGLQQVYFAVPDVITSNTAPRHLLEMDPLSIVSENGVLFIDDRAQGLQGDFTLIPEQELLHKQWTAKLYLHNTPHCIAAYMGALVGVEYVHEAMAIPEIARIVKGSMEEMLNSLKLRWDIPHPFLDWYAEKELARFSCTQLYDPISRVAREPLRKLESDGRLIGAAQICLSLGFVPNNILLGIASAMLFENSNDSDRHLAFMRRALTPATFLTHVLNLRRGEALEMILEERLPSIMERLEALIQNHRTPSGVIQ